MFYNTLISVYKGVYMHKCRQALDCMGDIFLPAVRLLTSLLVTVIGYPDEKQLSGERVRFGS